MYMRTTIRILVSLVLYLAAAGLYAQQRTVISGVVHDAETGQPLAGANVVVEGTVLGASADTKGRFSIPVSFQRASVSASMMGYEQETKEWKAGQGSLVFRLKQAAILQQPVVVTAAKSRTYIENSPVSIDVVGSRDVIRRSPVTIDEVLETASGVRVIDGQLDIRGASGFNWSAGSRVLLLVDGHPMISGDAGSINWDIIPVDQVERVEILKGAGSALYGSNAMAGVVNIITKQPSPVPKTAVKAYWGVYDAPVYPQWRWTDRFLPDQIRNGRKADLASSLGYKGVDVTHTRYTGRAGLLVSMGTKQSTGYHENGDFISHNLMAKVKAPAGLRGRLEITGQWSVNNHGDFIQWKSQNSPLEVPAHELGNRVIYEKASLYGSYNHVLSKTWALTANIHWYRCDWQNYFSDNNDYAVTDRMGLETRADYVSGRHSVTMGVDGTYYTTNSLIYGDRSVIDAAVYAEDKLALTDKLYGVLGARYDFHTIDSVATDQQVSPRTGLVYKPAPGTALRVSAGHGFRAPSIAEVFANISVSGFRVVGNPGLDKAERSWNFEAGFRQAVSFSRPRAEKPRLTSNPGAWLLHTIQPALVIDVSLFWVEYKNMIDVYMNPVEQAFQFVNLGKARNRGVEVLCRIAGFGDLLSGHAGYTYLDPVDCTTGSMLPYRSRHRATAGFDLSWRNWRAGMDFSYASRIEEVVNIYNADERVPEYVTDVRAGYSYGSMQIDLSVKNIGNYHYTLRQRYLEPVRTFIITLRGEF